MTTFPVTRRRWLNFFRRTITHPVTGCLLWQGPLDKDGYASYSYKHFRQGHTFVHDAIYGKPPQGWTRDHKCRRRNCVEYTHIEAVPHRINCLSGDTGVGNRTKTHCPKDHAYTPDNTYWHKRDNGTYSRRCKVCHTAKMYRKYSRYRASKGHTPTRIYYSDTQTKQLRWVRVQG